MLGNAALILLAIGFWTVGPIQAQQTPASQTSVLVLPDTARWNTCEGWTSGCEALVVRGDPATGPSHLLVRLAPGSVIPLIRHASTEHFVVVAGTFVATQVQGRDVLLRPGAYWYVPEGVVHGNFRCAGPETCMFYESHDKRLVTTAIPIAAAPAARR